jgi:hypothetical protein
MACTERGALGGKRFFGRSEEWTVPRLAYAPTQTIYILSTHTHTHTHTHTRRSTARPLLPTGDASIVASDEAYGPALEILREANGGVGYEHIISPLADYTNAQIKAMAPAKVARLYAAQLTAAGGSHRGRFYTALGVANNTARSFAVALPTRASPVWLRWVPLLAHALPSAPRCCSNRQVR